MGEMVRAPKIYLILCILKWSKGPLLKSLYQRKMLKITIMALKVNLCTWNQLVYTILVLSSAQYICIDL